MYRFRCFRALIAAATVSGAISHAVAGVYSFTNILEVQPSSGIFLSGVAVNNSGVAAFWYSPASAVDEMVTGSGGPLTVVATDQGGPYEGFSAPPDINNAGTVAFGAGLKAGGGGIYSVTSSGVTTTIATSTGLFSPGFYAPTISNQGSVVFIAGLSTGGLGIYTGNGGTPNPIMNTTSGTFTAIAGYGPHANGSGTVAFAAENAANQRGVYTYNNGTVTTIAITGAQTDTRINSSGQVAFFGFDRNLFGAAAIYKGDGGSVTEVANASSSSPFSSFQTTSVFPTGSGFAYPGIADDGTVIFGAQLTSGAMGIFTGSDPVADKVIETGDSLFGSTLTGFGFSGEVSGNGNIGFVYELANGQAGIAVATPVPEPNAAAVVGLCLLAVSFRLRASTHQS